MYILRGVCVYIVLYVYIHASVHVYCMYIQCICIIYCINMVVFCALTCVCESVFVCVNVNTCIYIVHMYIAHVYVCTRKCVHQTRTLVTYILYILFIAVFSKHVMYTRLLDVPFDGQIKAQTTCSFGNQSPSSAPNPLFDNFQPSSIAPCPRLLWHPELPY